MCVFCNYDKNVDVYMFIFLMKLLYFLYGPQKAVRVLKFVFVFVSLECHTHTESFILLVRRVLTKLATLAT